MPNTTTRRGGRAHRRWRAFVLRRADYLCQLRYPELCTTRATQADHIERVVDNPAREYDPDNGRAVCEECHKHRTALQAQGKDRPPYVAPSRTW